MSHLRSLYFGGALEAISQKTLKAFQEHRPSEIIWNITSRCNLKCRHCYADCDLNTLPQELSTAEALNLLDQMAEAGVPLLFVTGGEPMTRPDFWELLARAQTHGIRVVLSTNAILIDDAAADRLVTYDVDYVATSLYGPPAFHDEYVGVPGAWAKTTSAVKRLQKRGVKVGIKTTVTTSTLPYFYEVWQTAKDLGCGLLYACDLVETGRAGSSDFASVGRESRISKAEWRQLADFMIDDILKDPYHGMEYDIGALPSIAIYAQKKLQKLGLDVKKGVDRMKIKSACPVGKGLMGINAEGGILPCSFVQEFSVGNVRDLGIRGGAEKLFEIGRTPVEGNCGACEAAELCRGCRVKAWHDGNLMGGDRTCILA